MSTGKVIDNSLQRGYTNLTDYKFRSPFTGRHIDMHILMKYLREKRLVQVIGQTSVGKTRLVYETGYYMHVRSHFPDGIVMLDLSHVKTVE